MSSITVGQNTTVDTIHDDPSLRHNESSPSWPMTPKLSAVVPEYVLGCAAFSGQINFNPEALPVKDIIRRSLQLGIRAFDTSPYYGDSESLLGGALFAITQEGIYQRQDYLLMTKVGRIDSNTFDYSRDWVRNSVERSLRRFHTTYLDVVFCHDVEFVTTDEVVEAVSCLFELVDAGKISYVGISGYTSERLCELSALLKERLGRPLDAIQSYANFTLQSTTLQRYLPKLRSTGVDVVFTSSPISMGLLRKNGVPIAELGDFHPAPHGLRVACKEAAEWVEQEGDNLASLAMRFVCSGWNMANNEIKGCGAVIFGGCSSIWELEENMKSINQIMDVDWQAGRAVVRITKSKEDERLVQGVRRILGKWVDYTWESPTLDWVRTYPPSSSKI